jgi:hypothetical protein
MEMGRVPIEKENFLEFKKLFRYKMDRVGINRLYDSLIERNYKKGRLLPF